MIIHWFFIHKIKLREENTKLFFYSYFVRCSYFVLISFVCFYSVTSFSVLHCRQFYTRWQKYHALKQNEIFYFFIFTSIFFINHYISKLVHANLKFFHHSCHSKQVNSLILYITYFLQKSYFVFHRRKTGIQF